MNLADLERQADAVAHMGGLAMAEHNLHRLNAEIARSRGEDPSEAERRAEAAKRNAGIAQAAAQCLRDAIAVHRRTYAALGFDPDWQPELEPPRLRVVGGDDAA